MDCSKSCISRLLPRNERVIRTDSSHNKQSYVDGGVDKDRVAERIVRYFLVNRMNLDETHDTHEENR